MKYDTTEDEPVSFFFEGTDDYGEWLPIPWVDTRGFKIPFGYKQDPDNPNRLLPIKHELDALEQARSFVKTYTYATVAKWLKAVTGREMNYTVLWRRFKREREFDKKAAALRRWAERYKAAIKEAERLEFELVGAGRKKPYYEDGTATPKYERRVWQPVRQSVAEHITPDLFDDGTPPESDPNTRECVRRPRRPRSTRKPKGDVERTECSIPTEPWTSDGLLRSDGT